MVLLRLVLLLLALTPVAHSLLHYQRLHVASSHVNSNANDLRMRLNPTSFPGTDYIITEFPRPSLRRVPNAPVSVFDDRLLVKTQQMIDVMYGAKGVGLAAPQVGLNEALFVYNPTDARGNERVVCNPAITRYSEEVVVEEEGCLSLRSDECSGQVARSAWIEAAYENELGQKVQRRLKGFEARVFQHEYDHLQGVLCYDRYPPEDREAIRDGIERLLGLYVEEDAVVEPDAEMAEAMQPRPLSARWMPPLEEEMSKGEEVTPKRQKAKGVGGFGMGGGTNKKTGKKKEKKKKVKVRNGARSDNPKFKTSGKTPYANRK